jgi:hypothetical protein
VRDRLRAEIEGYWEKRGVDIDSVFGERLGLEAN